MGGVRSHLKLIPIKKKKTKEPVPILMERSKKYRPLRDYEDREAPRKVWEKKKGGKKKKEKKQKGSRHIKEWEESRFTRE